MSELGVRISSDITVCAETHPTSINATLPLVCHARQFWDANGWCKGGVFVVKKVTAVLIIIIMLVSFAQIASAAKPVKTLSVELTSIVDYTATFNVSWSKYPVYRCSAYAQCYLDEAGTIYSGYMIGMGDVINDGKTYRNYSVTGCTIVFGQNALIDERVQPVEGKYCRIVVHIYDKEQNDLGYAVSNVMLIP